MANKIEIGDRLELDLRRYSKFKIGKTGQSLEERFKGEYADEYESIQLLGWDLESDIIDDLEKHLIWRFKHLDNCQNDQVGGGEMARAMVYRVYVVFSLKK